MRSLTTKVSDPMYDLRIKGQTPLTIFDVGASYLVQSVSESQYFHGVIGQGQKYFM